jgi:rod shape-determining protein MreD
VRSFVALAAAAVVSMLLQTTIFPAIPGLPVVPDLILVLVVYLGVAHQTIGGAVGAFVLGYFLDTFSGTLLGLNTFALSAVYVGVQFVARHLWFERGFPVMALALFGGAVREVAAVAVGGLTAAPAPTWHHVMSTGIAGAVTASLVAPAVFAAVAWEKRLLGLA